MSELNTTLSGIQYKIEGDVYPVLTTYLKGGDEIYSEAGAMSWMSASTIMKTGIKGFLKIFSRLLTREKLFITKFTSEGETPSEVSFTTTLPGAILAITLKEGQEFYCQKDSFLCAEPTIELKATLAQHFMGAFFGGEGIILQKITGHGTFFIEIDGQIKDITLGENEILNVDEGNLVFWDTTVDYTARLTKGGPFNWLFGGEGLFMGQIKGPGHVILQTMPAKKLARSLGEVALPPRKRKGKKSNIKKVLDVSNFIRG